MATLLGEYNVFFGKVFLFLFAPLFDIQGITGISFRLSFSVSVCMVVRTREKGESFSLNTASAQLCKEHDPFQLSGAFFNSRGWLKLTLNPQMFQSSHLSLSSSEFGDLEHLR